MAPRPIRTTHIAAEAEVAIATTVIDIGPRIDLQVVVAMGAVPEAIQVKIDSFLH